MLSLTPVAFTCPSCRRPLKVYAFPLFCACGMRYASPNSIGERFAVGEPFKPTDNGIPCEHRGEAVERIECGCDGVNYTYRCNNPEVAGGLCILRKLPKMPAETKALPCCLDCKCRIADGDSLSA